MLFKKISLIKMSLDCVFCKKVFSCKSSLNTHQKTSKSCNNGNTQKITFDCNYCKKKLASNQVLLKHLEICHVKKSEENKTKEEEYKKILNDKTLLESLLNTQKFDFETRIQEIQKNFEKRLEEQEKYFDKLVINETISKEKVKHEYVGKENMYKAQLKKYEEIIKDLQDKLAALKTPNVVNNTTNIQVLGNFLTQEHIDDKIKYHLTEKKILNGLKGIAQFTCEHILKDENGHLLYACYDVARQKFKYKDKDGNEITDMNAEKLVQLLGPSVVKKYQGFCEKTEDDIKWYKRKKDTSDTLEEERDYEKQVDALEWKLKLLNNLKMEIIGICNNNRFSTELTKLTC
jgi:hypothetical protein